MHRHFTMYCKGPVDNNRVYFSLVFLTDARFQITDITSSGKKVKQTNKQTNERTNEQTNKQQQ